MCTCIRVYEHMSPDDEHRRDRRHAVPPAGRRAMLYYTMLMLEPSAPIYVIRNN